MTAALPLSKYERDPTNPQISVRLGSSRVEIWVEAGP